MTGGALAQELEVAHRTVLRDMDALTEAGLPIITYQGNQGGFELGFSYRTRLTGLAADEAEALAVLLDDPSPRLHDLGMMDAARRTISKLRESLPDQVRERVHLASQRSRITAAPPENVDARVSAIADAVRQRHRIRLDARSATPREIHPLALEYTPHGWAVIDGKSASTIPIADWKDINISSLPF